ncbi:uncharacterized protein E0L32_008488 [Thyridium curvatum]|uniref:C3H1-type domain-containing protein n=1 Tax=Thyridium curvatum TaxID=1093900 RepID=A0A507ALK1_9PEZI|nr:uncharacterized protein E0L32_008488 [Thyridium curvatum]TPX10602.1 hypothetical protein E0L32_008488 [Thyridium curvatum]
MSKYPYGYGGGQWPTPPVGAPAYGYHSPAQNFPGTPSHHGPQNPNVLHSNYATSQTAFDHNMHTASRYSIPNSNPATANTYPVPGSWDPLAASPNYLPSHPPQHLDQSSSLHAQQRLSAQLSAAVNSLREDQTKAPEQLDDVVEDGEVSDGEFEDFYEPAEPSLAVKAQPRPDFSVDNMERDEGEINGSGSDLQDDAFYEDEPGEVSEDTTVQKGSDSQKESRPPVGEGPSGASNTRERSGSYSPYLSPREVHHEDEASDESMQDAGPRLTQTSQTTSAAPQVVSMDTDTTGSTLASTHGASINIDNTTADASYEGPVYSSVQDAKKEAQKAILRLYSAGVKYQNYIDEGFDENLMKTLFAELGLQPGTSKHTQQPSVKENSSVNVPPPQVHKSGGDGFEERKDRIARLLAARKSKSAQLPPQTSHSSAAAQLPRKDATATVPAKPKTKSAKELLLQQKLEALQKSRQEREARARANTEQSSMATATNAPTSTANPRPEGMNTTPDPLSNAASAPQTPSDLPRTGEALLQGLSSAANAPMTIRKRPVASDFVDYSATVGSLKRPYGQQRHESSLVIDISDASDDEDIEMEVDSQADDADDEHPHRSDGAARKGPSVRDYAPLSDTLPPRQYASSTSSIQTPPNGFSNGNNKAKEDEYSRKMKEIEEMKRRIAAFEAKKARKTPSGSQTPTRADETPDAREAGPGISATSADEASKNSDGPSAQLISEAVSARLPKRSDSTLSHHDRRDRIVSDQIPKLDASLRQKMAKLRLLQDTVAQLQAEVDQSMAEKQKLAEEAEQLAKECYVGSLEDEATPAEDSTVSHTTEHPALEHSRELEAVPAEEDVGMSLVDQEPDGEPEISKDDSATTPAETQSVPDLVTSQAEPIYSQDTPSQEANAMTLDVANSVPQANETEPYAANDTARSESKASEPMDEDEQSDAYEPHEPVDLSPSEHVGLDSSQPSPASGDGLADKKAVLDTDSQEQQTQIPSQISAVVRASPEVESGLRENTAREVQTDSPREPGQTTLTVSQTTQAVISKTNSSFTPYDSPLKYFRAYRFHPQYEEFVAGGLRSLTYNSKIKPHVQICPLELEETECPRGASCEFQHFRSMPLKDDQILVELGKSDDFSGEQKVRFVQGLREVLQQFRAGKVRDFDAIAHGIIEYRRRFIGDNTRVLSQLEGVSL